MAFSFLGWLHVSVACLKRSVDRNVSPVADGRWRAALQIFSGRFSGQQLERCFCSAASVSGLFWEVLKRAVAGFFVFRLAHAGVGIPGLHALGDVGGGDRLFGIGLGLGLIIG